MIKKQFVIGNKSGLHVRPASILASASARFESDILIHFEDEYYNAKSVINVLAAGVRVGDSIEISAQGNDEAAAMEEISKLILEGFGQGVT